MKICFNSLRIITLAGVMAASVVSCKRSCSYMPVAKESVPAKTTLVLDSLVKEGKKIGENEDYVYLGGDTLELTKDFTKNPAGFISKTSLKLRDMFNDQVCIDGSGCIYDNANRIGANNKYLDMYIDKTVVIPNSEIFTTDSKKNYVPVEYYGRVNPKIISFL